MKTKNILLAFGILALIVFGVAQIPTILPVSPVTEFVDFLKGMRATGPLELGPVGRSLKTWWNFEDFQRSLGSTPFNNYINGAGAELNEIPGTALRMGILTLSTGTTTTGLAEIYVANAGAAGRNQFLFGGGVYTLEGDIYIPILSVVGDEYAILFGFSDTNDILPVDGAYFLYSRLTSVNWYKCTVNNGTRTTTDTTVAAIAGAWTRLKVVVNAAGTSVEYFINGTSVGVVTTNIPITTGRETGISFLIIKSAGTTARLIYIDWTWIHIDLTTSR